VRYLVLGVTEVWAEGRVVPLGGGRLRALVAALALHGGRVVSVEELVGEVWAGEPPADATGALQALVARLRRLLGREAVASEPGGYRLTTGRDAVDLYEFEQLLHDGEAALAAGDPASAADTLTRALALWRGPALADLPDRASAAARPEALRQTALRLRIDADLALDRAADALPVLREAVADHPLDEAFRVQLIRALRAEGRTADALVAFDEARTVLADTLGADPGPELRALHAELLRRQPVQKPAKAQKPRHGSNLRTRLTSFVGREADLADIRADLSTARLVTLTGPGGSGKTRLSQEAAESVEAGYPDGVWMAELAPLDDPAAIPHAVLSALGRRDAQGLPPGPMRLEAAQEDPVARLLEHCAPRRLLLVLDNCEHVIAAAAELTAELLGGCPDVTVLTTSREPLGVPGEVVRPVEPLPPATAYRLFTERAATVTPGAVSYDSADEQAVREICRRLDGLPLAIELAAARLRALSPRQIADRLDDRFRLLTSGSRTLLPRQQTLRAVVDWSWELLTEEERATLRAFSVFAGGCTLSAAEAVCGPGALETVAQLVDKSLVVADRPTGLGVRYRLLETIHEYAAEHAAARPDELAAAAGWHTAYYLELARTADAGLRGSDQLRWFDVLETELDNVRAALHRTIGAGQEEQAIGLSLAMGWFWWLRNYRDEADVWLGQVAALSEMPEDLDDPMYWPRIDLRMLRLFVESDHASEAQWQSEGMRTTATRLADAYSGAGPEAARFPGLLWPFTTYLLGDTIDIRDHTQVVVENCRAHGGDWELAAALMFRTHVAADAPGGLADADADWSELEALSERLGDRWIRAQVHGGRAEVQIARGQYEQARANIEIAHRLGRDLGSKSEAAFLLARLGDIAHRDGDDEAAGKLLDEAMEEAERYYVPDARTYIRYLRAVLLLRRGEVRAAAELCGLAGGQIADGTPPPTFHVMLSGLRARISAAQGDPHGALAEAAAGLRRAIGVGCNEPILGGLMDSAAEMLSSVDQLRAAEVLRAAATAVRGPLPRTVPEQEWADAVEARAAAGLTAADRSAAVAEGADLSLDDAVELLTELAAARPPAESSGFPDSGE
jgi:predicted ATPase/DNA-binding SARP family transcriptional activator